ncbi:MAG TPA: DUF2277 domain-containing protein [Actinomycetota bacterium]|nr:DUF2277 domain-containing protein [Actinomycetota bacterium]
MCRSIKTLRGADPTPEEIHAAALQYVRKVSGYRAPSRANTAAFEAAVQEITQASARLLDSLQPGVRQEISGS